MSIAESARQSVDGALSPLSPPQVLAAFSGLMLGMLLGALDQTILATALPTIVGELGGLRLLSWVVSAYLLTSTVSIPLWGKLGDLYGRKVLFQVSLAVFLAGSALCGVAPSVEALIGFRALQGIGAGGMFTLAMAIVSDLVSPRERGRFQGYVQAMFALASIAGPLIGGSIIDHLSWRWIFYVNVPIGAVAVCLIAVTLRIPRQRREHVIDYSGALLLAACVTCLLLALVWGGSVYDWSSPIIIALAVAVPVLGTTFVVLEQRVAEPVLPLNLLRDPVLVICSATVFLSTCAFFAAVVFLPLFLQLVRGDTGTSSGLLLLPMMLGATLSATASGQIISWSGRYKWSPVLGLAPMAVALSLFAQMGPATEPLTTALLMAVFGVGFGMVGEVMILAVQNAADMRDIGAATGIVNLFRALGGSVGVGVYGSIFNSQLPVWTSRLIPDDVLGAVNAGSLQSSPAVIHTLPDVVRDGLALATANALSPVFLTAAVLAAIALLIVSFLEERPLRTTSAHENRSPLSTVAPRAQVMQEER